METVAVYEAENELLANSVRDLLLENGIAAALKPIQDSSYGGALRNLSLRSNIWGEVLIGSADVDKAEELIYGFLGTLGYLAETLDEGELSDQALKAQPPETDQRS
jgi:hypothetical protein